MTFQGRIFDLSSRKNHNNCVNNFQRDHRLWSTIIIRKTRKKNSKIIDSITDRPTDHSLSYQINKSLRQVAGVLYLLYKYQLLIWPKYINVYSPVAASTSCYLYDSFRVGNIASMTQYSIQQSDTLWHFYYGR